MTKEPKELDYGTVFLSPQLQPQVISGLLNNAITQMVHEEGLKVRQDADDRAYRMVVKVELTQEET